MENHNYNLPWGFTFNPTDEDIIRYLHAKANNFHLPFVDPVVEFDVYTTHPTQLHMHQRLNAFSTHLYFYVKKSGRERGADNGFWLASTGATAVLSREGAVIGHRRMLVYHNSSGNKKRDRSAKTKWIMHEYRLPADAHDRSSKVPIWTICKIGETGRTFGGNYQSVPSQQQPQQQQLEFDHNVELVPHQVDHHQQQQFEEHISQDLQPQVVNHQYHQEVQQQVQLDDGEEDIDQHWIHSLESSLEVEEGHRPIQQFEQQPQQQTHGVTVDEDGIPLCICLDDQSQQQQVLMLLDEDEYCNKGIENWICNFDSCMEMIKERHDQLVEKRVDEQHQQLGAASDKDEEDSQLEYDEESSPKRTRY